MRFLCCAAALLLVTGGLLHADDPEEPPADATPEEPPAGEIEIPDAAPPVQDESVARLELRNIQQALKEARRDDAKRASLLAQLGDCNHPLVLRECGKHLRDREAAVALAAVMAVARQTSDAGKAGGMLHARLAREERPEVLCAVLVGMGRLGYAEQGAIVDVRKLFETREGEVRKAAARYFGYVECRQAFRMIAERLDEPTYVIPTREWKGPREEYYKFAWREWKSNRPWYRWALSRIAPGETFDTTTEARQWAEGDAARELGISWD